MKFEQDEVRIVGGVRHGSTQGGPVAIEVEDGTFGSTLAGRQAALQVARNVLAPFFA